VISTIVQMSLSQQAQTLADDGYLSARADRKSSSEGLREIVTPTCVWHDRIDVRRDSWGVKLGEDKAYTLKYIYSFSVAFSRDKSGSYYTTQDTEVYPRGPESDGRAAFYGYLTLTRYGTLYRKG